MAAAAETVALHPLGTLYGRWAFNFMVEIATAVAHDFTERPQHYRKVSDELARTLSGFRSSLGSHPDWPDAQQRTAIFRVLGAACLAGGPLREAALVYVESGTDLNRELLTDVFRDAAQSFRNQLKTVEGHALDTGFHQGGLIFRNAMQVFQSEALMRATCSRLRRTRTGRSWARSRVRGRSCPRSSSACSMPAIFRARC